VVSGNGHDHDGPLAIVFDKNKNTLLHIKEFRIIPSLTEKLGTQLELSPLLRSFLSDAWDIHNGRCTSDPYIIMELSDFLVCLAWFYGV
jgi:hypothetical protein